VTLTPPPFDPELEAALPAIRATRPAHPTVAALRSRAVPLTEEQLARDGAFRLRREGNLLFCVPAGLTRPGPALYLIHGGGMVAGHQHNDLPQALDWASLSAGGGLAAAVTLLARDRGGPALAWTSAQPRPSGTRT
jgi:acetyl esterase/lipase